MDASSLLLQNNLFVTEASGDVYINENFHIVDTTDLDNDGSTTDYLGKITDKKQSITITPNTKQLDFTAEAKMSDEADSAYRSGTGAANRLYLSDATDRVNYRLTLHNDSGSIVPAGNFMYYIPIPRTGNNNAMHTHMVQNNSAPGFDLTLTGPVSITGSSPGLFDLRYSTDATVSNYNNGQADYDYPNDGSTWKTEAEMTAAVTAGTVSWADVRMIKLVAADIGPNSYIPTDTLTRFTLTLAYAGNEDSILQNAGVTSVWCCCGAQKYLSTGELSNGTHTPTAFITVMLRSERPENITLTAAKDMTPTGTGASKTAAIRLPVYTLAENISIRSVTTNNVVLRDSATVTRDAATASGEFANSCFAITAKLDSGTAHELSAGVASLGTTSVGTASTLTLELFNYDALSDITTPRSVTLVLGDGDGVQITVNITIAHELAQVVAATHIEGGKSYQVLHGETHSATIRQDGGFTAQYALEFNPANCTGQSLSLLSGDPGAAINFPVGTTLTLLDLSDSSTPGYYYYSFAAAASTVALADFSNMSGSGTYNDPGAGSVNANVNQTLLLVADFSGAQSALAVGSYTLKLSLGGTTYDDIALAVEIASARSFSITAAPGTATVSDSITVTGTASTSAAGSVSDSRWVHRKMALVVTLKDSGGNSIAYPDGAVIVMNETRYVPSGNAFILPLDSIATRSYSYTLSTPHTHLADGSYTLSTELYISATASADAPMGGERVGFADSGFTVSGVAPYAVSLNIAGGQLVPLPQSGGTLDLPVTVLYNQAAASAAITLELQEKSGETYLTRSNLITGASAGGTTYIVDGYGVIQLPSRTYSADGLSVTLNINANNLTVGKTYRILAKAVRAGENVEAVYNIVIVESGAA